jgi:hypothetical protein
MFRGDLWWKLEGNDKCNSKIMPVTPTQSLELETGIIPFNFPPSARTAYATQFCSGTEPLVFRHVMPGVCNKYFYCWSNLWDKDGEMRRREDIHHYEFTCPKCSERNLEVECGNAAKNSNQSAASLYLQFDYAAQDCILPIDGNFCTNTSFALVSNSTFEHEPEEIKQSLYSLEAMKEAEIFCKKAIPVPVAPVRVAPPTENGNHLCHTYYVCWSTLFDSEGDPRPLEVVKHFKFRCDKIQDGHHFRTFDNETRSCIKPNNGQVCRLDGTWGPEAGLSISQGWVIKLIFCGILIT